MWNGQGTFLRTFEPSDSRPFLPNSTKVTSTIFSGNAARSSTWCTTASTRDETRCECTALAQRSYSRAVRQRKEVVTASRPVLPSRPSLPFFPSALLLTCSPPSGRSGESTTLGSRASLHSPPAEPLRVQAQKLDGRYRFWPPRFKRRGQRGLFWNSPPPRGRP